jgi:NAD(P)-dependent dehydrogenase (short-subunit alcohol dehydrogenase family)
MKSVVVTGASSGIGRSCVQVLSACGFRVFGSVRRQEDANRLSSEFGANFSPLIFDVTDEAAVVAAAKQTKAELNGETLFGLVNNAGISVPGPLLYLKMEDFRRQIEVSLTGQLVVTQAFAPLLGIDRTLKGAPGRIVMISSFSAKNAFPFAGAYSAAKFGLEGMSESLRRELMIFGVEVIIVAPGDVVTPIWDKADSVDVSRYDNTAYASVLARVKSYFISLGKNGLPPERIGEAVKNALSVRRPKTRYTVTPNPIQTFMLAALPKRTVDAMIANRLGLKKS